MSETKPDLKPCPLCGGMASRVFEGQYSSPHSIRCGVCGASTDRDESESYTAIRWARRVEENLLREENDRLCSIIGNVSGAVKLGLAGNMDYGEVLSAIRCYLTEKGGE